MISIIKAKEVDFESIVKIGQVSVYEAHIESCSPAIMNDYIQNNYNNEAIKAELNNSQNIYHIIKYNGIPVGFSKIILNAEHANIIEKNVAKLDRIYLLKEYQDLKLGFELLKYNIQFCKTFNQSGIWLFTWIGNKRAINFYKKTGFNIIGNHQFRVAETHYNENHQMLLNFTNISF